MDDYKMPGQLIDKLLADRGWSKRTLSVVVDKSEATVNRIIAGKQPVDANTALLLEEVFEVPAEFFMKIQREYDLALARISSKPDAARAQRAYLYDGLPIPEMVKRGWLTADNPHNILQVQDALTRFFGVASLEEIEILPHAARKTTVNMETTPSQLAWLYRVRAIAQEILIAPYSQNALRSALPKLKGFMCAPEEARNVPRLLAECGVRFVIVESLPGAKIDGVCFWLNDKAPVIGMTIRHDRIDNFWFVLRHEIEHVLQGHGKHAMVLDTELEGAKAASGSGIPDDEKVANDAASEFCVPQSKLQAFIAGKAPLFSERDLIGFARVLGVHPGIIAGQIQYKTERYDRFRQHLMKVRSFVTPTAAADGWGDVYPIG